MSKKVLSCLLILSCIFTAAFSKPSPETLSLFSEEERVQIIYDAKTKDYTVTMDGNVFRCRNLKYYEPEECITFGDVRLKFLDGELKLGKKTISISKKGLSGDFPVLYPNSPKFSLFNKNDLTVKEVNARTDFWSSEITLSVNIKIPDGTGGFSNVCIDKASIYSPDSFGSGLYGPYFGTINLGRLAVYGQYYFEPEGFIFEWPHISFPEETGLKNVEVRGLKYNGKWESWAETGNYTDIFGISSTLINPPEFTKDSVVFKALLYLPEEDFLPHSLQGMRIDFSKLEVGYDGQIRSLEHNPLSNIQFNTRYNETIILGNITVELREDGLHLVTKNNEVLLRDSQTIPFEDIDWNLVTGECNVAL